MTTKVWSIDELVTHDALTDAFNERLPLEGGQMTGDLGLTVAGTVSAAGTDQSTATALTAQRNVITTVASGAGVRLTSGADRTVLNVGANPLKVYPHSGAAIGGEATNASIDLPVGAGAYFEYISTTSWRVLFLSFGTGALGVAYGGTGLTSGTSGGVLAFTASGTLTSSAALAANQIVLGGGAGAVPATLGSLGTTAQVLHGNGGGAPTWGAVSLTADVSGILPVANGGTGLASGTSGGILGYTASGTLASSGTLTQHGLMVGGGAGATPSALASLGTSVQVLHGNASGDPTWSAVSLTADVTGTLPVGNGGTGQTSAMAALYALLSPCAWSARPSAASNTGKIILVTDIGIAGGSLWISDGTEWQPLHPITLARGHVAIPHTGDTSETAMVTYTIPANLMGLSRTIEVRDFWTYTNSANNKLIKVRFGGISGTAYTTLTATTSAYSGSLALIQNCNNASSQIGGIALIHPFSAASASPVTSSVDTTAAVDLVITGQLANSGETISLVSYEIVLRP